MTTALRPAESLALLATEAAATTEEEAVRLAFKAVERAAPAPADLLSSDAAGTLDGEWVLEYTVAAFGAPGAAAAGDIDETSGVGVSSAVNASGITVDVNAKKTTQTFDLGKLNEGWAQGRGLGLRFGLWLAPIIPDPPPPPFPSGRARCEHGCARQGY